MKLQEMAISMPDILGQPILNSGDSILNSCHFWSIAVEVKGSSYPRFPAPVGAQIQVGHLEHLFPVLKTEGIAQGAAEDRHADKGG